MKIQFKSKSEASRIVVRDGDYRREFIRDSQPYSLSDEWSGLEKQLFQNHDVLELVDDSAPKGEAVATAIVAEPEPIVTPTTPTAPLAMPVKRGK